MFYTKLAQYFFLNKITSHLKGHLPLYTNIFELCKFLGYFHLYTKFINIALSLTKNNKKIDINTKITSYNKRQN